MIYYLTVHWKSDRWIDIQSHMISRYTDETYEVWGYLTDVERTHYPKFNKIFDTGDPAHEDKLDLMANEVLSVASSDDDLLIFLDGDAFPIAAPGSLREKLRVHRLVAVQRLENLGERQPHPCFCVTTVGLWKEIGGTWRKGYKWINAMGNPETDAGGELLRLLLMHNISWLPLHRSNRKNLNPIFFGIYGDMVYHHGAGFRGGGCRILWYERGLYEIYKRPDARILNNLVTRKYQRKLRNSWIHPEGRLKRKIAREIAPIAQDIYNRIKENPDFVFSLIDNSSHKHEPA